MHEACLIAGTVQWCRYQVWCELWCGTKNQRKMLHHKIGANFLHHFFYCFFLTIGDKKHCKKGICNFYISIIQSRCPNILSFPFSFLHHRWDKEDCGMECHKEKWTKNKNCKQSRWIRLVLTQRLGMRQVCQCNEDSRVQCREGGGHRESVGDGAGGGVEPGEPAWCGSRDQAPGPGSATQWTKSTFYWLAPARTSTSPATSSSPWSQHSPLLRTQPSRPCSDRLIVAGPHTAAAHAHMMKCHFKRVLT